MGYCSINHSGEFSSHSAVSCHLITSAGTDKGPEPAQILGFASPLLVQPHLGGPHQKKTESFHYVALVACGHHNLVLSRNPACSSSLKISKNRCFKEHGYVFEQ